MSTERELLKKALDFMLDAGANLNPLFKEINDNLLAQPEQDNTQYLLDQVARLTAENAMLKEKWLAPRRKPLSDDEIVALWANKSPANEFECVRLVEKEHGIGGG